jgi:hypothetical protein
LPATPGLLNLYAESSLLVEESVRDPTCGFFRLHHSNREVSGFSKEMATQTLARQYCSDIQIGE